MVTELTAHVSVVTDTFAYYFNSYNCKLFNMDKKLMSYFRLDSRH